MQEWLQNLETNDTTMESPVVFDPAQFPLGSDLSTRCAMYVARG